MDGSISNDDAIGCFDSANVDRAVSTPRFCREGETQNVARKGVKSDGCTERCCFATSRRSTITELA